MLWYSLGPDLRRHYRSRASRTRAFTVAKDVRAAVRSTMSYLRGWLGEDAMQIKVLPLSSRQCLSERRQFYQASIVIIDAEHVNALEFLLARKMGSEAPIFHYVEFMIRIGELLASSGKTVEATRVTQLCQYRLEQYSDRTGMNGELKRFQDLEGLLRFQDAGVAPLVAFILGHEIGHFLIEPAVRLRPDFQIILKEWFPLRDDFSLIGHDYHQKLDDNGRPCGRRFSELDRINQRDEIGINLVSESLADYIGVIAFTRFVAERGIAHAESMNLLFDLFVAAERLSIIQWLIHQIPNPPKAKSIKFPFSQLPSRLMMLITIIGLISDGTLHPPDDVAAYWKTLSKKQYWATSNKKSLERLASIGEDPLFAARGGFYLGTGASSPMERSTLNSLREDWGNPLANDRLREFMPFINGEHVYDLSRLDDEQRPGVQGHQGFGCAIRDATHAIMFGESVDETCGTRILTACQTRNVKLWDAVRSPRQLVMDRCLPSESEPWP
jgi:hypothetical protein